MTEPMTTEQLVERLRALAEARGKATKGEWRVGDWAGEPDGEPKVFCDEAEVCVVGSILGTSPPDAAFIALAANTISPALLEAVEGLVREREAMKAKVHSQ